MTVLVTGSSRGIGKSIAMEFAKKNYNVVLNCVNRLDLLRQTEREISLYNENVLCAPADLSNYDNTMSVFAEIKDKFGGVDVLINNAGISHIGLFQDMKPGEWERIIDVNQKAMINCCHAAIPNMISKKSGIIINISSIWGERGASCEVVYSMTKGGVNSFTKALAKELAPSGIRVNAISCGMIDTEMNSAFTLKERQEFIEAIPLMRMGKAEEVAKLAVFLALQDSAYITGQIIGIDGGL